VALPTTPLRQPWSGVVDMPREEVPPGTLPILHPHWLDNPLIEVLDMQFWANIYSTEITSNECLSEVLSLLSCPSRIAVARSLRENEAQTFIDFLDRVSTKLHAPCLGDLGRQTQILVRSRLDGKPWQRCLRLLSKICKASRIVPTSYILQQELIRVGRVRYYGGFADVSDGDYLGCPVAIKRLKMEGDSDRLFKVLAINLMNYPRSAFYSDFAGRSSVGNTCPTQTYCLCWEFLYSQTLVVFVLSPSGCPTGM
jgi:hypothetical protein